MILNNYNKGDIEMAHYFQDCMKQEDLARLPYLPTVAELLEKCKREYPELPAISNKTVTYTYDELCSRVARRRQFLWEAGLKPGDRIAVMARNGLDAMELYLAVMTAGCTVIMLPNALNEQALAGISMKFGLSAMFCEE